ncbi:hypothetical protein Hanom_Chr03g00206991 [Helianthus anomalus]
MPSSYPGRYMPLPKLESSTFEKRWVSVANWATPVGSLSHIVQLLGLLFHNTLSARLDFEVELAFSQGC